MEVLGAHVSDVDAFTITLERDPLLRSTIVAVAVFAGTPDFEVLRDRIDRATRLAPTFREVLVASPLGLAPPRWMVDPAFDLDFHLRRVAAPAAGDLASVIEIARTAGMAAFDPARPLWEFTLVEGMKDGRSALVMKVHHALTDGIGGIQLAALVVDFEPTPAPLGAMPAAPRAQQAGPLDAWRDVIAYDLARFIGEGRGRLSSIPGELVDAARHPFHAAAEVVKTTAALARFVRPVTTTKSQVMARRRLQWHFGTLDLELDALRRAAKTIDGTLNDGFVGGITGGLRRYHDRHGSRVGDLRLTMPISVRTDDHDVGGNHITLVRFEVPVGIADPAKRMTEIDERCVALRRDRALPYSNAVAGMLNLLPTSVSGGMLKHVDFVASNVPGFPSNVYLAGAELEAFYPFGPTIGSAANITLMSYRGRCHIGVNTDCGAVPDPNALLEDLRLGFEEVLDLAGDHEPVSIGPL